MARKKKQRGKITPEVGETSAEKQREKITPEVGETSGEKQQELMATTEDSIKCYAEWPQLEELLTPELSFRSEEQLDSDGVQPPPNKEAADVSILVPECGYSKLSENLYDAGFKNITNLDSSAVVIGDMMKRNEEVRPEMKWDVMDIKSKIEFANETFDVIVDQGGLDSLMPDKNLGSLYLSEVKRVLKAGGKYVCLTLAGYLVLDLLFPMFRFGWKRSLYPISQEASSRDPKLQTFMVVAENDSSRAVYPILSFVEQSFFDSNSYQAQVLFEALHREEWKHLEYADGFYSLEDLHLGAIGNLSELVPGRRVILSRVRSEGFTCNGVLLDAKEDSGPFTHPYAVFLVPQNQASEWHTSEEGQWRFVQSSKASRLLMMDLTPLVKHLGPEDCGEGFQIPYLNAADVINNQETAYQDSSVTNGPIGAEDVFYQDIIDDGDDYKGCTIRHLIFRRTENVVQSRALLSIKESNRISTDAGIDKEQEASTSDSQSSRSPVSSGEMKVVHNHLVSRYHRGIVFGIRLIPSFLKSSTSARGLVNTVVIGLGAGLLPMFMKNYLPSLKIEVVELDHKVLQVARDYFGFINDESLKVHITDGTKFVRKKADGNSSCKIDILVVDVHSSDSSSALTCPAADFVDESFLCVVKDSLSEQGLFIINLVSGSSNMRNDVHSKLKKVFSCILSLPIQEDINEVLFALKTTSSPIKEDQLSEACEEFAQSLKLQKIWIEKAVCISKLAKPLD